MTTTRSAAALGPGENPVERTSERTNKRRPNQISQRSGPKKVGVRLKGSFANLPLSLLASTVVGSVQFSLVETRREKLY